MTPYYDAGGITLYCGDCLTVMAELEAQSFDATITDVPYGTTACAWDSPIPFVPMWAQLRRLGKPRAAHVLFGSQPFTSALIASNYEMFRDNWVWDKNTSTGHLDANRSPLKRHEDVIVFSNGNTIYNPQKHKGAPNHHKGKLKLNYKDNVYHGAYDLVASDMSGDKYPHTIINFDRVPPAVRRHESEKPLALMEYLIKTYTNEGDLILDFTCGSGTTLRAAKNLKRRAVGIEQLEHYCEVAVNRLEPAFEEALIDNGAALGDLPMFADFESEAA